MLYYTQIIYIKPGQELIFQDFEDQVLPLLDRHRGELLYRARPAVADVLATAIEYPYEIHVVGFTDRSGFESYRDDPQRLQYMYLKEQSVARVLLIEGKML